MSKIEYDNFPKFLVSVGIVLFALPILIVHFFLQENAVLLVTEQELSQLSPIASQVVLAKQNLCLWLTNNIFISGKKDILGQDLDPLDILRVLVNDYDEHEEEVLAAQKYVDKVYIKTYGKKE